MNFVSIDFETANEKRHSPCAIGIVVANEHEIIDEYYSLINPLVEFRSMNTYIHGITERDVEDAPTFETIWPAINKYLANNLVIAHNASFDMSVIRQSLDYFDLAYPEMDYLCTANISKRVWPDLHNHKLNTLAKRLGITFDHHHALEDARVAAKILMKAIESYESETVDLFLEKCSMTKGRMYDHGYCTPKVKRARRNNRLYIR